jgi:hypothetical protein
MVQRTRQTHAPAFKVKVALATILIVKSDCSYSPHEVPFSALYRRPDPDKNSKPPANGRQTAIMRTAVALAAIKGEKMLAELAQQYDVHPNQITAWIDLISTAQTDDPFCFNAAPVGLANSIPQNGYRMGPLVLSIVSEPVWLGWARNPSPASQILLLFNCGEWRFVCIGQRSPLSQSHVNRA